MQVINDMIGALGVKLVKSTVGMKPETRNRFARALGWVFWYAVPKRRKIALRNLELCFPEKTADERLKIAKNCALTLPARLSITGICGRDQSSKCALSCASKDWKTSPEKPDIRFW